MNRLLEELRAHYQTGDYRGLGMWVQDHELAIKEALKDAGDIREGG